MQGVKIGCQVCVMFFPLLWKEVSKNQRLKLNLLLNYILKGSFEVRFMKSLREKNVFRSIREEKLRKIPLQEERISNFLFVAQVLT